MTDAELARWLGIDHSPDWPRAVSSIPPERRATLERMVRVSGELNLWQAGLGPKPPGVMVDFDRTRAHRKLP